MPHPMRDVIVVLPGILGSTLYRGNTPVWEPSGGAFLGAVRTLAGNIKALRLPEGIGDDHPGDGVEPRDLMPDVRLPLGMWTFDLGYTALLDFLRTTFDVVEQENLIPFAYDWRLSNRYNGARLGRVVEAALERWRGQGGPFAEAKVVFIAHSMGGLVARWYVDHLGGAEITRRLITLGTPHRGALNALDQLSNGVRKGIPPIKADLTLLTRSLPSAYQLLPEYACIEKDGALVTTADLPLPELVTARVADARSFFAQIDAGRTTTAGAYQVHPILGFEQPTLTTARLVAGQVVGVRTIEGQDEHGDATVPRLSAAPGDIDPGSAVISYVADNHGGLIHNGAVFDQIEGILTAPVRHRAPGDIRLGVEMEEVLDPGEALVVRASVPGGERVALEAVVTDADGRPVDTVRLTAADGALEARPDLPGPGGYLVTVRGVGAAVRAVAPVTTAVLAWPPEGTLDLA